MKGPSFLRIFDAQNGLVRVELAERATVEAAVAEYLTRGRERVLHLRHADGCTYAMFVSDIRSWAESTPAIRDRGRQIDKAVEMEGRKRQRVRR